MKHYAKLHTAEGEYEIVVREMNLISMATLKVSEPYWEGRIVFREGLDARHRPDTHRVHGNPLTRASAGSALRFSSLSGTSAPTAPALAGGRRLNGCRRKMPGSRLAGPNAKPAKPASPRDRQRSGTGPDLPPSRRARSTASGRAPILHNARKGLL